MVARVREKILQYFNRKLLLRGLAVVLVIAAGWIAWSELRASSIRRNTPSSERAGGTPGVREDQIAPDFSVPTLEGDTFRLSEQRGRPTIVFIMAYWCGTCIPEAQALGRVKQEYGDGISILSLDVDPSSTPEALAQFKSVVGNPTYVWGFDTDQAVAQLYEVHSLDATIIIDATGRVIYRDSAPTPFEQLNEVVAPLVEG